MNDFNIISVRVRKMPPFTQEERKRIFFTMEGYT